jgi:hypothetical protein
MKRLNLISSIFLVCLSVAICLKSIQLGIGDPRNPGMGFMPFLASSLFFVLSLLVLIRNLTGRGERGDKDPLLTREKFQKPMILIIGLSGYIFIFNILGFILATLLLIFLMLFIFDPKKWYMHIVIAAVAVNLSFLIFCKWLQVPLPTGVFHIGF